MEEKREIDRHRTRLLYSFSIAAVILFILGLIMKQDIFVILSLTSILIGVLTHFLLRLSVTNRFKALEEKIDKTALNLLKKLESKKEKSFIHGLCHSLFVIGIVIFIIGILFQETFAYILGIMFVTFSLLTIKKPKQEKQIEPRKELTKTHKIASSILFFIGAFFFLKGIGKHETLSFLIGVLVMCIAMMYTLTSVKIKQESLDKVIDISFVVFLLTGITLLIDELIGLREFFEFLMRYDNLIIWSFIVIAILSVLFYRLFKARIRQRTLERFMVVTFDMFLVTGIVSFVYQLALSSHMIKIEEGYDALVLSSMIIVIGLGIVVAKVIRYKRFDKKVLRRFVNFFLGAVLITSIMFLAYEGFAHYIEKERIDYLPTLALMLVIAAMGGYVYYRLFNKIEIGTYKKIIYVLVFIISLALLIRGISNNNPLLSLLGIVFVSFVLLSFRIHKHKVKPAPKKTKRIELKLVKAKEEKAEKIKPITIQKLLPVIFFIIGLMLLVGGLMIKKLLITGIAVTILVLDILISLKTPKKKAKVKKAASTKTETKKVEIVIYPKKILGFFFLLVILSLAVIALIKQNTQVLIISAIALVLDIVFLAALSKRKFAKTQLQREKIKVSRAKAIFSAITHIVIFIILIYCMLKYKNIMLITGLAIIVGVMGLLRLILKRDTVNLDHTIGIKPKPSTETEPEYQTDLDKLYYLIQAQGTVNLAQVVSTFKVSSEVAEEWALILEEKGLAKVIYPPVGWPRIKNVKDSEKKVLV